jgi:hypothetical protein
LAMELIAQKTHTPTIKRLTNPQLVVRASSSRISAMDKS